MSLAAIDTPASIIALVDRRDAHLDIVPQHALVFNSGLHPISTIEPIDTIPVQLSRVGSQDTPESQVASSLHHVRQVYSRPANSYSPSPDIRDVSRVDANQPPPSPQAADLRFPTEIWLRIFDHALVHDQKSVLQASALCSGIRWTAEEALYRFPEVLERSTARAFTSAIAASASRAQAVKGLSVGCRDKDAKKYIPTIRGLLPKLTRLGTLHLANLGTCCVDVFTSSSLLKGLSLPSLKRIRGQPLYLSPNLISILASFPRLEEIRVYDYTPVPPPPDGDTWTDEEEDDVAGEVEEEFDMPEEPDNEKQAENVEILAGLPNLRALACPSRLVKDMHVVGRVTSLCITKVTRSMMAHVASLFGEQLVSLRVERTLGPYRGLAYPTAWTWTEFTRLRFLDVQDIGVRRVYHDNQKDNEIYVVKTETLPPSLDTLVWGATWVMDCALFDGQSEAWRRNEIRRFSEDTLRRFSPTLKTVMYRWGKKSYQCELAGDRFSEGILGVPGLAGDDAWAEAR
ncbi:hypothetical protein C8Q79DRAFT_1014795 [Trametes meyenii]|nr:hypothetical protein C8Q79DRAFT_1014795 [Trametes meyenii]